MWKYRKKLNDFMTAVADTSDGEIWVYGDIVDDVWWDNEVSPVTIRNSLDEMGPVSSLNIRVNSYGGSVYAGNAIINILDGYRRKTGAKINAYIEGIAASMGSGIPMVADKIYMAENAMYMLHKPFTLVYGNSDELEKNVEILEKAEDTLVTNYMRHFKGTEDELRQMLSDETWLTASEALEYGLCDEIIPAVAVAASARGGIFINRQEFQKNAEKIVAMFPIGTPLASAGSTGEGDEKMHEYDEKLKDYGISEEVFYSFDIEASAVMAVIENAVIQPQEKLKEYLSADSVKNALGEDMDVERLLALAKAGMEADSEANVKAKAYDKMVSTAIENALKSGVRAKGENFNDTKWKKILSSLDYDEIVDQQKEWEDEAKVALKAGVRASQPWTQERHNRDNQVNADDYGFAKG